MNKRDANVSGSLSKGRSSKRRRALILMRELRLGTLPSYFETENKEDILSALKDIEADVLLGRCIRWNRLFLMLRGMTLRDETAPQCLKCIMELLRVFEKYHCKEPIVIKEVFEVLLFLTQPYMKFLKEPIKFQKFFCLPYGEKSETDFVWSSVKCANLGLLKLQLKYGMGLMKLHSKNLSVVMEVVFMHCLNSNDDTTEDGSPTDNEIPMEDPKATAAAIRAIHGCNFSSESLKRLDLVFRIMRVLLKVKLFNSDYKDHFTECYRLLFQSIPEPYVTSVEVKAILEKCLPDSTPRLMSRIADDFRRLLPELAEVPQPRSLKHLCRVQVRQCLRQNVNLPSGVSPLPLPTYLKDYIMLNDDGDYSVVVKSIFTYGPMRWSYSSMPESYINIPERDDCVTSFLKNLL